MAQPAGRLNVNGAHEFAGTFIYAHDDGAGTAGLWDALNGVMLAKTGAGGGVTTEGGAKVVSAAQNAYFLLASALTFAGASTIAWKARTAALDNKAMVVGKHTATTSYAWMNDGANNFRWVGLTIGANANSNVMDTYHLVRVGLSQAFKLYRGGVLLRTLANSGTAAMELTAIFKGYSTNTTFDFSGALEWFHAFPPGTVLTDAQVAAHAADPYAVLSVPVDATAPTLSSPTVGAASGTTATGGVTTTEAGPAWAVLTTSSTTPTAEQIKAGQSAAGTAASATATSTLAVGANAGVFAFTGLTPGGTYYLHVTQDDAATTPNTAAPVTSASMTTPAPDATLPVLTGSITLNGKTQTTISVSWPAGSDNVAVTSYEVSRDSGSTWTDVGNVLTYEWVGLTSSTTYGLRVRAKDAVGNVSTPALTLAVTTDAPPSGTITITSPTARTMRQRSIPTNTASFTVTGAYTGTPGSIQYRFAGGAWQTLVATPAGGAYSAVVSLPTGQGMLEVRHSADTSVTASVALVTVGDIFATAGQSNNVGAATSVVAPVATSFQPLEYVGGSWVDLREGTTTGTSYSGLSGYGGSYIGALCNRLQAEGIPVGFVPCAQGSTMISNWQKGGGLYTTMISRIAAVGGVRSVSLWLGESDANNGTAQTAYESGMHQMINDIWTDISTPVFMHKIVSWIAAATTLRTWQDNIIASNPHVIGSADCDVYAPSGVHYLTTADINAVAGRVYAGMVLAFYSDPVALSSGSDAVNFADAGGSALFAYSTGASSDAVMRADVGASVLLSHVLGSGADAVGLADVGGSAWLGFLLSAGFDAIPRSDASAAAVFDLHFGGALDALRHADAGGVALFDIDLGSAADAIRRADNGGSLTLTVTPVTPTPSTPTTTYRVARLEPIKRGTSFDHTIVLPDSFPDGYFFGSTVTSQVRDRRGNLVATLEAAWLDVASTREIRVFGETADWPLGTLFTDVRIARASDRLSVYTDTVRFRLKEAQTRV